MTTAMQKFDFGATEVRVHTDDEGRPWWVLADVCDALGISNGRDLASRIPDEEKGVGKTDTLGGAQDALTISEPGLYRVIFRSNKPAAEKFRRWVFHEVLPSIRTTGGYQAAAADLDQPVDRIIHHADGRVEVVYQREAPPLSVAAHDSRAEHCMRFLRDRCDLHARIWTPASELHHAYRVWALGQQVGVMSATAFGTRLRKLGFTVRSGLKRRSTSGHEYLVALT